MGHKFTIAVVVLCMIGLAWVTTPATAQQPQYGVELTVTDTDLTTTEIEVSGYEGRSVIFGLTITFTEVVEGFDVTDITLVAARGADNIVVPDGASAAPVTTTNEMVFTTNVTVLSTVDRVGITIGRDVAKIPNTYNPDTGNVDEGQGSPGIEERILVEIVRVAPPPDLTVTGNTQIGNANAFTFTLTSATAIILTETDIKVTGGVIDSVIQDPTNNLVWTVTISRLAGRTAVIVESAVPTEFTFQRTTFTVDAGGPVATITGTPPATGGGFWITISFNEPLGTGATLVANEITVTGGTLTQPTTAANTNAYTAFLTPGHGVTTVTVQINAGAVTDATGNANVATAHVFTIPLPSGVTIPAGGFLVVVPSNAESTALPSSVTPVTLTTMLDLEDLLFRGGTIDVFVKKDATTNLPIARVIVTEIMWALDKNINIVGTPEETAYQWLELYNGSTTPVQWSDIYLKFLQSNTSPAKTDITIGSDTYQHTDRVSNVDGTVWTIVTGLGQNGSTARDPAGRDFISMYRTNYGENAGILRASWAQSTNEYIRGLIGTPGERERSGPVQLPTATVPTLNVIFSEIANRTDDENEWIEFKNTSRFAQNVTGWMVSIVTAIDTEELLFSMPSVTIPPGGVLLVTDKDPESVDSSLVRGIPLYREVDIGALPNTGNFVLVLRNSDNIADLKTANSIVDVAGYYPNSTQTPDPVNPTRITSLWPLYRYAAPLDKNNLIANKVYMRQHEDIAGSGGKDGMNEDDKVAFQPVGYIGIGYERSARKLDENGGTPGYPNDIRKNEIRDIIQGNVTISEIMYATTGRTNEIQWIELYNSSKTEAVALDADSGWHLTIENYADPNWEEDAQSGTINFKDHGDVKTIPPNQTVLIVSARGRRSATPNNVSHFPANRVFSVYTEIPDEFDMQNSRSPFLHPTKGFHIELFDGTNRPVDEVGNLDGRLRTQDEPTWELPTGITKNDERTSLIRRYREYNQQTQQYTYVGVVQDGTEREGWVVASLTEFKNFLPRHKTWYGLSSDIGSPGHRMGTVLPVTLSQFQPALTHTGAVVIKWTTESELDNAGFNILRSETRTGEFQQVNRQLVQGAGTTGERTLYTWTDTTAKPNVVYYYRIEDVSFAGERQTLATSRLKGFVSAKGKLTTQWATLKSK